jgi:hypothetical protein
MPGNMIAVYLLPFPVRAVKAPYLWVFYKMLTAFDEEILFLIGKDYLVDPSTFGAEGRWELGKAAHDAYGYRTPAAKDMARHTLKVLPDSLFEDMLAACLGNPVEVFRKMLSQRIPALEQVIESALSEAAADGKQIEAFLTWCNCPSLSAVAAARGLAVVHLEVGPLRAPEYRPTAYVDFSGVNGDTEAAQRYFALGSDRIKLNADALLSFFYRGERLPPMSPSDTTGVALQVEDDSNLVAYGNGFDNQSTIVHARFFFESAGPIRVRGHPGSVFWIKQGQGFEPDDSRNSIEFIRRCTRVVTINSSVGLEAILMGIPVRSLGECSYKFILDERHPDEVVSRLAYYLFGYLVPRELLFDLRYLRFRIGKPTEAQIVARHVEHYGVPLDCVPTSCPPSVWDLIGAALGHA